MSKLCIGLHKGIHITFDNDYTISIQIGPANYCDNYDMPISDEGSIESGKLGSTTAEIAIWNAKNHWYSFETNTFEEKCSEVKGYVPMNEVLDWINKVRTMS